MSVPTGQVVTPPITTTKAFSVGYVARQPGITGGGGGGTESPLKVWSGTAWVALPGPASP